MNLLDKLRKGPKLPPWAYNFKRRNRGMEVIHVDADRAYPMILEELKNHPGIQVGKDTVSYEGEPDCYWKQVAYHIIVLDLQQIMGRFAFEIHIKGGKSKWSQCESCRKGLSGGCLRHSKTRGAMRATGGKEARMHWQALRERVVPGGIETGRIVR